MKQSSPAALTLCLSSCQTVPECQEGRRKKGRDDSRREAAEEEDDNKAAAEEEERSSDEGFMGMTPLLQAHHAMEKMEEFVHKVSFSWSSFCSLAASSDSSGCVLPNKLRDNVERS